MTLPNVRAFTIIWTNLKDAWTSETRNGMGGGGSPSSFAKVDKLFSFLKGSDRELALQT